MAESFSRWESDPLFSAAEVVQDSADRMESVYRSLLHEQSLAQEDPSDGKLMSSLQYHKRDLSTALETTRWQLEDFEREVNLAALSDESNSREIAILKHKQFIRAIREHILQVEGSVQDASKEDHTRNPQWMNLNEHDKDMLTSFLSGGNLGGHSSNYVTENIITRRFLDSNTDEDEIIELKPEEVDVLPLNGIKNADNVYDSSRNHVSWKIGSSVLNKLGTNGPAFFQGLGGNELEKPGTYDLEFGGLGAKSYSYQNTIRGSAKAQLHEYKERISQLESSLTEADYRNSELVQEVKNLAEMCDTHEGRASAAHQRSLELEDLVQLSHSKAEDAGKKVVELEVLLENARVLAQNMEQLVSLAEAKYADAEAELKQYSSRISELSTELEAFQTKSESLEIVVQAANEKEKELTDTLDAVIEEKKKFEELSNISSEKLLQAENLVEVLQSEKKLAQERLESIEEDLRTSGVRESEILEKLKSAEERLEHHGREAEQASARCLELESVHESLRKESELKLQDAVGSFTLKDSEVKQLQEKVTVLEEQVAIHQHKVVDATEKVASLKAELDASAAEIFALENTVKDFKGIVSEYESKLEQSSSENELLAGTNSQLRSELEAHQSKVNELNDLLGSIHAEKEATAEQLASHAKTIEELTNEHSRGLELNSTTELRMKETELQLHEALEKFTQRDSEARGLNEKLVALEAQLRMYEEQLGEVTAVAENRKSELDEALLKIENLKTALEDVQRRVHQFETEKEGLARANMIQTEQLATYEAKINKLEMSLNAAIADKEDASLQLHSSKKTIEDLTQQLASDGEKLQSQIFSVMEENNTLNKMYQNAKEELQLLHEQLEEQNERGISVTAEVENLKSEIASMKSAAAEEDALVASRIEEHLNILNERDFLNEQLNQLQKDLSLAHSTIAEQKELESKKELERHAATLGEVDAEHQRANLLEKQVEELKQKLQLAETQYNDKVAEGGRKVDLLNVELGDLKQKMSQNVELEKKMAKLQKKLENAISSKQVKDVAGAEVRSRDIGFGGSSSPQLGSREGSKGAHPATEMAHVSPPSGVMAFKFIIGVALVSVIIGIILGKQY